MSDLGYSDTPLIPGTNWHVHDGERPQPRIVTPSSEYGAPPSDTESCSIMPRSYRAPRST